MHTISGWCEENAHREITYAHVFACLNIRSATRPLMKLDAYFMPLERTPSLWFFISYNGWRHELVKWGRHTCHCRNAVIMVIKSLSVFIIIITNSQSMLNTKVQRYFVDNLCAPVQTCTLTVLLNLRVGYNQKLYSPIASLEHIRNSSQS